MNTEESQRRKHLIQQRLLVRFVPLVQRERREFCVQSAINSFADLIFYRLFLNYDLWTTLCDRLYVRVQFHQWDTSSNPIQPKCWLPGPLISINILTSFPSLLG